MNNLITKSSKDYELLDSGEGEKLERFRGFILRRPDAQALYQKGLAAQEWEKADAAFESIGGKGKWRMLSDKQIPETWVTSFEGISFSSTLGSFKHTGVFPEQFSNWQWLGEVIEERLKTRDTVSVLNLFAYTGGATLACLKVGAEVVHVDASSGIIENARKNAELSGLQDRKVRWIADDVKKFVAREIRRGNRYHGIIMDPPSYGHGPKREVWDIETDLLPLIEGAKQLLHEEGLFFLINGYSAGYSPVAYANNLLSIKEKKGGVIESGELVIEESASKRLLPAGIFARWRAS